MSTKFDQNYVTGLKRKTRKYLKLNLMEKYKENNERKTIK